ncbi:hypothetical protein HUK80_07360 [Flavobacterium sp. MAH-1]|uniref:Uncharacterized protein n=1 Tax=Flavobacterium agri TaxID=2743471 RepID=A0A7Y8Y3Q2_9FLAO|nr:hypothetical protein [Flavobacterium agri]NUY80706.1 hypothetical protein [Flavobacterium agri]NYA70730.1 hypothetical protein [Flavobacterium agri]
MKRIIARSAYLLFLFSSFLSRAQVGIGTVTPSGALDVVSTTDGLLIPRISLTATNVATVVTPTVSELVYNTNTSAAGANQVTPGYYYWNGSIWVRLATGTSSYWALTGNSGTAAGTNFLGTTDAVDLRIRTNNTDRWNISNANNGQLQSFSIGTSVAPTFSFTSDPNTGIFSSGPDALDFSTGAGARLRIPNADQVHALALGTAALPFYSFSADANTGIFSPSADALSVATNGTERIRVDANGKIVIGATTANAMLDVTSTNDGLLIPRVALTATNSALPLTTPTTSELVYNTATAGTAPNNVTPAFYYWDGAQWTKLAIGNNNDWTITGNSGTVAGTNFIGTSDAIDLRIKTNNTDRWNISNANNGQLQPYSLGTAALPIYSFQTDTNTGIFSAAADNLSLTTNGVEGFRLRNTGNVTIGTTYASVDAAPTNGLRVQGSTVIGKANGEDSRDVLSAHTSATSYGNLTGYPNATSKRALAAYADAGGIGVLGYSNNTGYGVVGLTKTGSLSSFIRTGEGLVGQADGATTGIIPIGSHGVIDETATGNWKATGVLGENNNITQGLGFQGGSYNQGNLGALSGVYGNIGSRVTSASSNSYMFGVVGDILTLGSGTIADGTGGVLGFGGSGNFGMLGYRGLSGITYSVYGGGSGSSILAINTGNRMVDRTKPNNRIGLGITGGFMGGYVAGNQFGLVSHGSEFGAYVQGKTIVNEPIVKLTDNGGSERSATFVPTSTEIDIMTRGKGQLQNGTAFIAFKSAFAESVASAETINVTITPTAETKGVFVNRVTEEGFYVTENGSGTSNASFNWVAVGTQKGFEDGMSISKTVLAREFDDKMKNVMASESQNEGTSIYYDGQNVRFDRIPESFLQHSRKEESKK